jgi:hypothetical protein
MEVLMDERTKGGKGGQGHGVTTKQVQALVLELTDRQKEQIQAFWRETGSIGTAEIKIDVVNDRISPASIQVGTAK